MKRLFILLIILCPLAHSETKDDWRCTDQSTTRSRNVWMACGTGEYTDEGAAREKALANALNEFKQMCDLSSDCKGRELSVEPKRQTCQYTNYTYTGYWKCYKLVQITVN